MTLLGRRYSVLQTAVMAVGLFALSFSSTLAIGRYNAHICGRPALTVLGSGGELSILVTDGPARFLLAAGDDSSGFGNALARARPMGCERIDVLLLAGSTTDVTFLARARRAVKARHFEAIGKPDLAGALGLSPDSLLPSPQRFLLSADTRITVETVERPDARDGPSLGWRATIEHGATRVIALSDGRFAGTFPDVGPVSALIVGGAKATAALEALETRVFVAAATENSGKDVREAIAAGGQEQRWAIRVFPGEAKRFSFTDRGLGLPRGAVPAGATPDDPQSAR